MTETNETADYQTGLRQFAAELLELADAGAETVAVALAPMLARGSGVGVEIRLSAVRRAAVTAVVAEEGGNQRAAAERIGISPGIVSRLLMPEEKRRERGRALMDRKLKREPSA